MMTNRFQRYFSAERNYIKKIKEELKALRTILRRRVYINPKAEQNIVDQFHRLYYDAHLFEKTWVNTFWLSVPTQKCPLDLWVYQEIIHELKPDVIVECGTLHGGSALFLASMCDLVNNGKVVTVDIQTKEGRPEHRRITYLHGSSTDDEIVATVEEFVNEADTVLVILDSDHGKENVLRELRTYSRFVTLGSYLIVEDTCVGGHPVLHEHGPGPMEALEEFLPDNKNFVVDRSRENHLLTFNPKGYLLRVA